MIILTIRTDKPEAEVGLYEDGHQLAYSTWEAHRELGRTIHKKVKALLDKSSKSWTDIQGIVVYKGPGSFTGLRIGIAVANALAYGLKQPVISTSGEDWLKKGIQGLVQDKGQRIVLPDYGSDPRTTQQIK
jgi:tRNA threonylcarbamoyladenosine biosynthesis protein TsaB